MAKPSFNWISFVGGVAAGVLLHKYWPDIVSTVQPLTDKVKNTAKKVIN